MRAARRSPDRPPERPPAGPRAGARRLAGLLLVALAGVVALPPAFPADRDAEQRAADSKQKLYVLRALGDDPALAACTDIWVDVDGTTASLRGKVPSAMLKQRALFVAGRVKGVATVNGDGLEVVTRDGLPDLPSPFPEGTPPRDTLAGNHKGGRTTQAPKKTDLPDPLPPPLHESVILLPPVPLTGPTSRQETDPPVVMLHPRPLTTQPDLSSAVEALRQKDDRFRRVRVEVRQKTVYLRGAVRRWDDVNDLANAVRRLPGVEAVILDSVQVDGNDTRPR